MQQEEVSPEQFLWVDVRPEVPVAARLLEPSCAGERICPSVAGAESVVLLPLGVVGEHLVGLGHLLELFLRVVIALVGVGMVLLGQLVVGLLDVFRGGVFGHVQGLRDCDSKLPVEVLHNSLNM